MRSHEKTDDLKRLQVVLGANWTDKLNLHLRTAQETACLEKPIIVLQKMVA